MRILGWLLLFPFRHPILFAIAAIWAYFHFTAPSIEF